MKRKEDVIKITQNFKERLIEKIKQKKSVVCVGIDPDFNSSEFPYGNIIYHDDIDKNDRYASKFEFAKAIIDEVEDLVAIIKPNSRFFRPNEFTWLDKIIDYAHQKDLEVIIDCKENDIGNTMSQGYENWFGYYNCDAITVNGYFGSNGVIGDDKDPIFKKWYESGKGLFVLILTSNPSSMELQRLNFHDPTLHVYNMMAEFVEKWSEEYEFTIGGVVGANHSHELERVRKQLSGILLLPAYGAQGASGEDLKGAFNDGKWAIVNSSRAIMYAYKRRFKGQFEENDFARASRAEVGHMNEDINRFVKF